jgi:hypothetical protein
MERGEAVRVDPEHPKYRGKRPWQYVWLADALRRRHSAFDGGWPWWLSCSRPDVERLRSATLPGGQEQAILELELPEQRVAIFPLWMWETIYTGHYLALGRDELLRWRREVREGLTEALRARQEGSWERLFDRSAHRRCWYRDDDFPDPDEELQALLRNASDETAALILELRGSDLADVSLFTTEA